MDHAGQVQHSSHTCVTISTWSFTHLPAASVFLMGLHECSLHDGNEFDLNDVILTVFSKIRSHSEGSFVIAFGNVIDAK